MPKPRPPAPPDGHGEGRSIHIGLNRIDQGVYRGHLGDLAGAENDARAMRDLANEFGFSSRLIVNEEASRDVVRETLEATISRLIPGDALLVTFAGHGVTLRGIGIETDGWDEAWCLYDGVLLDDEFHELLATVPAGCEVTIVTDSCFAAGIIEDVGAGVRAPAARRTLSLNSVTERLAGVAGQLLSVAKTGESPESFVAEFMKRAGPAETFAVRAPESRSADIAIGRLIRSGKIPPGAAPTRGRRSPISARVLSLAAAGEGELAFEGSQHGFFTAALLEVVDRMEFSDFSYDDLMEDVGLLVSTQRPTIGTAGVNAREARRARPFENPGFGTTNAGIDQSLAADADQRPQR